MNCGKCGYLLFGLASGRCPECGSGFKATDYGFPRFAVQFLCPHCRQGYSGTDEYGLPRPRTFSCVKCNALVHAGDMIVKPLRDGVVGDPLRFGSSWDHRGQVGALKAFMITLAQVSTQPTAFFRNAHLTDSGAAVAFAVGAAMLSLPVWGAVMAAAAALLPVGRLALPALAMRGSMGFLFLVCYLGAVLVWVYGFGAGVFVVLRLLRRSECSLDTCICIVAFATAVFPSLFFPPALIWYLMVVVIGVRETQDISGFRAAIATLLPILVLGNAAVGIMLM